MDEYLLKKVRPRHKPKHGERCPRDTALTTWGGRGKVGHIAPTSLAPNRLFELAY